MAGGDAVDVGQHAQQPPGLQEQLQDVARVQLLLRQRVVSRGVRRRSHSAAKRRVDLLLIFNGQNSQNQLNPIHICTDTVDMSHDSFLWLFFNCRLLIYVTFLFFYIFL